MAASSNSPDVNLHAVVSALRRASDDDRGTVQSLAQDLDDAHEGGGVTFRLSTRATKGIMAKSLYFKVFKWLQMRLPPGTIHHNMSLAPMPGSHEFSARALFFDHVVVNQTQYFAWNRANRPANAVVGVKVLREGGSTIINVGELLDIFGFEHPGYGVVRLGHMRWYSPLATTDTAGTIWQS